MGKKSSPYEPYPPCNMACHSGKCDIDKSHTINFPQFRRFVNEHMSPTEKRHLFNASKKTKIHQDWVKHQTRRGLECFYCSIDLTDKPYHIDHYIPIKQGGKNSPYNYRVACPACNLHKGAKLPTQAS